MISKDDVAHIAQLARIHLTPKETEKFAHELGTILDYIRQLEKVDTRGVPPTAHAVGGVAIGRSDIARQEPDTVRAALLASAPERDGEHVKVRSVFTDITESKNHRIKESP